MTSKKRTFTIEQVKELSRWDNILIAIDGKVYNVTDFLDEHPGGEEVLRDHSGLNATVDFIDVGHSVAAKELMKEYYIGDLVESITTNSTRKIDHHSSVNVKTKSRSWTTSKYTPAIAIGLVVLSIGAFYYMNSSNL